MRVRHRAKRSVTCHKSQLAGRAKYRMLEADVSSIAGTMVLAPAGKPGRGLFLRGLFLRCLFVRGLFVTCLLSRSLPVRPPSV